LICGRFEYFAFSQRSCAKKFKEEEEEAPSFLPSSLHETGAEKVDKTDSRSARETKRHCEWLAKWLDWDSVFEEQNLSVYG
jgi:hypothetical protein